MLSIGKFAKSLGVSIQTLRNWDKEGKLKPTYVTENGYRYYSEDLLNKFRNIKNVNRIITIFGCGGDRDRTKRPIMAKVVEDLSDIIILTSDNPRTENPEQIFADVKKGFIKSDDYIFEPDREKAIKVAVNMAEKNDIILITGKGHETYHIIGTKKWHFDDKEIARREIVRRKMVENVN